MQQALSSNVQNPLDANVESVLPGVHHQFEVLTNVTNGLDSKITNVDATVTNMLVSVETAVTSLHHIIQSLERRDVELASHFLQMAGRLAPKGSPPSLPGHVESPPGGRREPTDDEISPFGPFKVVSPNLISVHVLLNNGKFVKEDLLSPKSL